MLLLNRRGMPADVGARSTPLSELLSKAHDEVPNWTDVRRAGSWDLPIWVALGWVDSIELADSQQARKLTKADEAGSRPRDKALYSARRASAAGAKRSIIICSTAGCGYRRRPARAPAWPNSPVGYNRTYVYLGSEFSQEKWFEELRAGRAVVTNGPLIRPNVEGELPGHVFQADAGEQVELEVGLTLSTRDPVSYLEIVKDGRRRAGSALIDWAQAGGKLPRWYSTRAAGS